MRPARIEDVAARAGVSMKTVSRVLNNEPNVRPATREAVMMAVAALHYHPNPAARGLAGQRSYLVALFYGSVSDAYLVEIQSGILDICRAHHYGLVLFPCRGHGPELVSDAESLIVQSRIDGVILTPPVSDDPALLAMLQGRKIPHVRISPAHSQGSLSVGIDEYQAAADIMRHLTGLGHRRIGFIKGPDDHGASGWRLRAYLDGLAAQSIEPDPRPVLGGDFTFASGYEAGQQLIALANAPTAIFAGNDDMAAGVLKAAYEKGITVPGRLSVAGFDDIPLARQVWPTLTTIHQPVRGLGKAAARQLMAALRKTAEPSTAVRETGQRDLFSVLAYRIEIRESTGPVPK